MLIRVRARYEDQRKWTLDNAESARWRKQPLGKRRTRAN